MNGERRLLGLFLFMLRFFALAPVLVCLWWSVLPIYGHVLVQVSGLLARFAFGVPVTGVSVQPEGLLNTGTLIMFQLTDTAQHVLERKMPVALLVTNLVPYLALVLATAGLALRKRLAVLLYGSLIIVAGHILFITLLLRYQDELRQVAEVSTATIQFFLVLPFLLWIWFVYSERIAGYLSEEENEKDRERDPSASPKA